MLTFDFCLFVGKRADTAEAAAVGDDTGEDALLQGFLTSLGGVLLLELGEAVGDP